MKKLMYDYLINYLPPIEIARLRLEMNQPLKYKGLLINPARISSDILFAEFKSLTKDETNPNFFTYIKNEDTPGRNILHEAGAYYILDRSSMLISHFLEPLKNELVLDMCAAPGGKTISYALKNPQALIVANDFSTKRASELSKNIERMGLANVIVTNFDPNYFLKDFIGYFDKIILDAPCSGTGMFRKESKMEEDWSYEKTLRLLPLQDKLLDIAYRLLSPGGVISYSTCSFLHEEDEERVQKVINDHNDLHLVKLKMSEGFYEGTLEGTIHIFPHLYQGEGHFLAQLVKEGTPSSLEIDKKIGTFDSSLNLYTFEYQNEKYGLPFIVNSLINLPALRMGLKITNRTKYAKCPWDHALSHYLNSIKSIKLTKKEALAYLNGEELTSSIDIEDGYYLVSYNTINLGYVNKKGKRLKNCYPKGLRIKV